MTLTKAVIEICFFMAIAFFVLVIASIVYLFRNRKSRTKRLVIVIVYLFASVFFIRLAAELYMMTGAYTDAVDYARMNQAEIIFDSIIHGLQSFSMDEDYTLYLLAEDILRGAFMFAQIKTWGNSQGIWLSQGLPDSIGVHVNDVLKIKHKTLEERAVEFDGKVGPYEEYDWGKPQGKELW